MNYEKAYKDALERARELYDNLIKEGTLATSKGIESIFPELRESEDERISKEIIQFLKLPHPPFVDISKRNYEEWLAWLEKQKEENFIDKNLIKKEAHRIAWEYSKHYDPLLSKESWCEMAALDMASWLEKQGNYDYKRVNLSNFDARIREFSDMLKDKPKPYWDGWYEAMEWVRTHGNPFEKRGEQKSTDKFEPKFKVGDWILIEDVPCQIQSIDENGNYMVKYCDRGEISTLSRKFCESYFHIWTIEDAKDGDVLTLNNEYFLFKEKKNSTTECYISHCFIDSAKTFRENGEFLPIERGNKVCPTTKEQYDLLFSKMKEAGYEWDAEKKELKNRTLAWSEENEKKNYNERYKRIAQTEQFKKSYCDKSLGKEEPVSEDLKDAAYHFCMDEYGNPKESLFEFDQRCFIAGAEWQKQKDLEDSLKSDMTMPNKFYEKGRADAMNEIKEAVETTIVNDWQYGKDPDHAIIPAIHQRIDGFNVGDKVKIIIVKE